MKADKVILVNENDEAIGEMGKLEAHQQGRLHRAFSILIYNEKGDMLLQKRADSKYHSGGLWSNACCSHPGPDEPIMDAAIKRLKEEMGISCELSYSHHFIYQVKLDKGLSENELDHVFIGRTDKQPLLNPMEASAFKYMSPEALKNDMTSNPDNYTYWFKLIMKNLSENGHSY